MHIKLSPKVIEILVSGGSFAFYHADGEEIVIELDESDSVAIAEKEMMEACIKGLVERKMILKEKES